MSLSLGNMDNGIGCKEFSGGFGTSGMKKRVTKLNGTIEFNSYKDLYIRNMHLKQKTFIRKFMILENHL